MCLLVTSFKNVQTFLAFCLIITEQRARCLIAMAACVRAKREPFVSELAHLTNIADEPVKKSAKTAPHLIDGAVFFALLARLDFLFNKRLF